MIKPVFAGGGVDIFEPDLNPPVFTSFGHLIQVMLPNIYILAGVIFFFLLIAGGFGIIMNAGKGEKEGFAKNKGMVTVAIVGFLIIISSYWIIQIIGAITGIDILNPIF
ncbi:MAG: hypothetical protein JW991_03630 [Candidatus Pacebacteria bacterium]|nr:hypothetical protein [Candidatus Paceibacterota bacterium]